MFSTDIQKRLSELQSKPSLTAGEEIEVHYLIERKYKSQFRQIEPGTSDFEALAKAVEQMRKVLQESEKLNHGQ